MKNTGWSCVVMALLGGLVGGTASAWFFHARAAVAAEPSPRTVIGQKFALVDQRGKERALLYLTPAGEPSLAFYGSGGKQQAVLGLDARGAPAFVLYDGAGVERARIAVQSDGVTALRISDARMMPRTLLGVDMSGEPALDFYGRDGKLLRELP
jgi:hypothetical protein